MGLCVLCGGALDLGGKTVMPTTRGRDAIKGASKERGHTVVVSEGQTAHKECCHNFTNKHSIPGYLRRKQETESAAGFTQSLPSQNQDCQMLSFCGNEADIDVRNGPKVHPLRTLDF